MYRAVNIRIFLVSGGKFCGCLNQGSILALAFFLVPPKLTSALMIFLIIVGFSTGSLKAEKRTSWLDAISSVEVLLDGYLQQAEDLAEAEGRDFHLGPLASLGNACANCYWPRHECAILGRMLGRSAAISQLEPPLTPLTASLDDLLFQAQSLDQWLFTANRLLETPEALRANIWNLECVGNFGISLEEYDARGEGAASFEVTGQFLTIYGDVVEGFYEQLTSILDAHPEVQIVAIGSAGGSVRDAVLAGSEIRLRGLSTQLIGSCMSACPLVFMGGVKRYVLRPFPTFGFHQVSDNGGAIPFDDPTYSVVVEYVDVMGVSGDWILRQFLSALPEDMNVVGDTQAERDDLCRHGLVTNYQGFGSTIC